MRRFISLVSLFLVGGYLLMSALDVVLSAKAGNIDSRPVRSWSYLFKGEINSDCIFLGSSRALNHIVPSIIDSILGTKSYNLGMGGAHFDDISARYDLYRVKNPAPRLVVIECDYFSLTKNAGTNMDQFYPWFHNKYFREVVFPVRDFSLSDRFLPMYRYRNCLWDFFLDHSGTLDKGFLGFDMPYRGAELGDSNLEFRVNPRVEGIFNGLLDRIEADRAKVVLVESPMYIDALRRRHNPDVMNAYYDSLSRERGIPVLDYSSLSICEDSSFFANSRHLNIKGAIAFSDSLANDLKRLGLAE
ncbi:MAG: hypothetical protein K6F06_09785 [Bacteroidales bacterium]|nr:hypothetical protein [Bacteroidales bacterium]